MKRKALDAERAKEGRAVATAACVASLLMFAHTLVHRALAERLAVSVTPAPVDPNVLQEFPMRIADWTGEDVPMDEAIRERTDAEGNINRRYTRQGGLEVVSFYLAWGGRARDLMPHRPEVCYVGNGWTLAKRRSAALPLSDDATLPCNLMEFSRGLLNAEKIVVLHYYIVDGQCCQDVSLLRSKAWRGSGTVRSVAQIQITASLAEAMDADSAVRTVCDFAVESAPPIAGLFKTRWQQPGSGLPPEPAE